MTDADGALKPKQVEYHPVTGVPEEFHEFLHRDCDEFKKLKSFRESDAGVAEKVAAVSLQGKPLAEPEKQKPGRKRKPKEKEVVISTATRQRKKAITTVEGLDLFGIKLADAAKLFGKKFACGASVVQNPSLKDQIDIQGDVQDLLPPLILKQYGESHGIEPSYIMLIVEKQRVPYEL